MLRDSCPNHEVRVRIRSWPRIFQVIVLAALLASLLPAGCRPQPLPPPPPLDWPSRVFTEEGMVFSVRRLRIPGTRQSFILREGGATNSIAIKIIQTLRFTGPEAGGFRPAEIMLIGGAKTRGELDVSPLLEGFTDMGFWTIPLKNVARLEVGRE